MARAWATSFSADEPDFFCPQHVCNSLNKLFENSHITPSCQAESRQNLTEPAGAALPFPDQGPRVEFAGEPDYIQPAGNACRPRNDQLLE
ncbi:MAG: hypothetical protein ABR513_04240, partial [Desulfotignum sp.]